MIYFLLISNSISFLSMGLDKQKAKHHSYRISEKHLLLLALPFAAFGSLLGMLIFHHKIRKPLFSLTLPILCLFQIIILRLVFFD